VWVLWNNRNNKVWNDMADTGRSLGFKARHLWEEWAAIQQLQYTSSFFTGPACIKVAKTLPRVVQMQRRCCFPSRNKQD
jgi:hypothetical protein